jgi:hypothetical protein
VEPPNDSAPLVQKIGATSIAEIEKLIGELQETRNFLESEGERIQQETARYIKLTQRALASVRIIFDTLAGAAGGASHARIRLPGRRQEGQLERERAAFDVVDGARSRRRIAVR